MSGNLCRCAAYPNIVAAIREAAPKMRRYAVLGTSEQCVLRSRATLFASSATVSPGDPRGLVNSFLKARFAAVRDPAPGAAPDTSKSQRKSRCGLCERAPGRSEALTLRNVSAARRVFDEPAIPVGCKQLIAPARARAPSRQPSLPSVPVASASK
jgi:hypothetical protein